jgi:hypothetical protein
VKAKKPFDSRVEDDTWERYKEVCRKLFCFIQRTQDWSDAERPPYEFTKQQGDLFDRFEETVEEAVAQGADVDQGMVDRLCLDMMVALLDHPFKDSHYESAIISGLAVMGLRDDGGWARPEDYTPVYSAVIKVARMLVVYQAVLEREDAIAKKEETMSEEEARAAAPGLFRLVRGKVQRFMTIVTDTSEPAPMDWMFDARTYGMRIRFTTPATGGIDWQGDRVTYQRLRFSMAALADMVHELIREMKGVLGVLLMAEEDDFGAVPAIDWVRFEDDHSEDRVGYSFLQDDRNAWVARGHGWVLGQMLRRADKQAEWVAGAANSSIPYRADAVRGYGRAVDRFREGMLVLMHMVGGMPGRAWEVIEMRHSNTAYGGVRNIMIDRGMVCFVTLYHKNYRSSEQVKVIHRYLPREAGELVVWYLWLVLPFWQQVQGIVKDADEPSAFLWAEEIVKKKAQEGEADGIGVEGEAGEEVTEEEGQAAWIRERKWTPDRMRRIMQQYSERHLQARVGISAWRHIAIAISNRYLNKAFGQGRDEGDEYDEDDEGALDSIWDLQAGHSSHVAGMVYARELQQGAFGTAERRDKFRVISRQWHRFLGFQGEDSCRVGQTDVSVRRTYSRASGRRRGSGGSHGYGR